MGGAPVSARKERKQTKPWENMCATSAWLMPLHMKWMLCLRARDKQPLSCDLVLASPKTLLGTPRHTAVGCSQRLWPHPKWREQGRQASSSARGSWT